MNTKTAAPKGKKKIKPVRRAKKWGAQAPSMALRLLTVAFVAVMLGLLFSALQALEWTMVRIVLTAAVIAAMLALHYADGLNKGVQDAGASRSFEKAFASGRTLTDAEDAMCYHPMKALCAALMVYGIPLLMALYLSATAKPYTYALQDLPLWLSNTYGVRSDVMAPLAAYTQPLQSTAADWIRMFVRLISLNFVSFFEDPVTMSGLIDRLSPLFVAAMPLAYVAGYLCGPAHDAKMVRQNKRAKKVAARRAQRKSMVSELLGEGKDVHYGQRQGGEKHKKKELI